MIPKETVDKIIEESRIDEVISDFVALKKRGVNYKEYSFLERGSDERQYCSPGIDLPVCSIMRSKYNTFEEYHTSYDNLEFVSEDGLQGTFEIYCNLIDEIERDIIPVCKIMAEPMMSKRGLRPTIGKRDSAISTKIFMDFLIFKAPMLMVQASLDGILLGILFALIAYGMALQWGVMNIINIAQGDLVILGGYIAYTMYLAGIHPAWGVIVSPIIMFFVGWALYKLVINKVVDRDLFISILATFGIAIVFQQLMNFIFGADVVVAQSEYGTTMLFDNSVTLPNSKIFSAFISVLYAVALVIYMKKSRLGRAIRATAQNARAAKILGVDTEKVYAATFGINAALCGIAGALISITLTLHPYVGLPYTVRSFMIVIVAGLGNLPAVAVSGMGLGLFEEFADYILGTEFRIGAVFMLLVFILVYRRFKLSKKREYLK